MTSDKLGFIRHCSGLFRPLNLCKLLVLVSCVSLGLHLLSQPCFRDSDGDRIYQTLLDLNANISFKQENPFVARILERTINAEVPAQTSALWRSGCGLPHSKPLPACTQSSPRKKIIFVKVHKCASSTTAAIILRYATKKRLKIAAPKYDRGHVGWPSPFRPEAIWGFPQLSDFDVLAHHIVYDRCYVFKQFPKANTFYLTILREPFSQFKSSVSFFNELNGVLPKNEQRFLRFLDKADRLERQVKFSFYNVFFGQKSVTKNFMATELGFPYLAADNQTAVDMFIQRTSDDFDLVMIAEYIPESLVLLRRKMCWTLLDILHLKLNENKRYIKFKSKTKPTLVPSEDQRKRHRLHSAVDYALYDYFKNKLWTEISKEGDTFKSEVLFFKATQAKLWEFCLRRKGTLDIDESPFNPRLRLSVQDCDDMGLMPEGYTANIWLQSARKLGRVFGH